MDERQVILDTAQGIANLKGMPVEQVLAEATLEDALLYIGALQAGYILGRDSLQNAPQGSESFIQAAKEELGDGDT